MGYCWPLPAGTRISQGYGTNPGGRFNPVGGHTGTDFAVPTGTPLRASGDGVIAFIGTSDSPTGGDNPWWITPFAGNYLALDCGDTAPTFIYAHLSRFNVVAGQRVKKGEIIAFTGNSGTASTGPHLHMEALAPGYNLRSSTYGRSNPGNFCTEFWGGAAAPSAPNQRKAGPYQVKQRSAPKLDATIVRTIEPNQLEVFRGYVRGDTVTSGKDSSDLWLEDQHGYASVLLFDPMNVDGLPDLTPKPASDPVGPTQRVTAADGAQGRVAPDKTADAVGERFGADLILSFKGYVRASLPPYPGTTNVWFVSISGKYFWAGAFVDEGVHDLPDLTPASAPPTATAPPAPLTPAPYKFNADIPVINGITVENIPANISNVEPGNFPAKPVCIVKHHWQDPPIAITSVINEFKNAGTFKSANFIISDTRIAQMVKLGDRPYHAGPEGNVMVGFEIDPRGYERDAAGNYTPVALKIQENVRAAHAAVNAFYGYELAHILHKDVPGNNTRCSPFDLSTLAPIKVVVPPVVVPPVVVVPTPAPTTPEVCVPGSPAEEKAVLDKFTGWLIDGFLKRKK
jgi:murein DD-endopeptidase MepM/ murein hydrolase activator NlpD